MLAHEVAHGVDQLDRQLRAVVARGRLRAEDEGAGVELRLGMLVDLVVEHQDAQRVHQLALVLVQALGLGVEDALGGHLDALVAVHVAGQAQLVVELDLGELLLEGRVVREGLEGLDLAHVLAPAVADGLVDQVRQPGVALHQPAAVRDAVGDVQELARLEQVEVVEGLLLEDLGVDGGHAVDGVGVGHAQVRHVHLVVAQDGHVADAVPLAGEGVPQLGAQPRVHLLQDHVNAGQLLAEQALRPLLQRLHQHGVVGVGEGAAGDALGGVPIQAVLVQQDADQLGDGHGGVRVVDVDGHLVREDGPVVTVDVDEVLHGVLDGGGGEEVLLLEAQLLALVAVVVGIEDLGDDLGQLALLHGLHILAAVEVHHVDLLHGLGAPGAQEVDLRAVVAHHGDVVGHGLHGLVVQVAVVSAPLVLIGLDAAAEVDLLGVLGMGDLPDVTGGQPVVRHLHLVAVHQLLAEQAELIADGAAHGGQLQRGQGIQEAGGEAAQAAVAQAWLRLFLEHDAAVDAQLVHGLHVVALVDQVDHVVVQRAAHQELGGEVVHLLGLLLLARVAGIAAALHDLVAHHQRQRLIQLLGRGVADVAGELGVQFGLDALLDLLDGHPFKFHKNTSERIWVRGAGFGSTLFSRRREKSILVRMSLYHITIDCATHCMLIFWLNPHGFWANSLSR